MDIIIVSGFLGAGKTTFILEYIRQQSDSGKKFAVLVNEFGELSVDGEVIRMDELDVVELPSGCICCSLRASLPETVDMIFEKMAPDELLIEPSGIATPGNVIEAVKHGKNSENFRIKSVICIVDASSFHDFVDDFGEFYTDQIRTADVVMVNKSDMVNSDDLEKIEERIRELNPGALTVRTVYCRHIPDQSRYSENIGRDFHTSEPVLESLSLVPSRSFSADELEEFLRKAISGYFGTIIRAKGFVECDGLCMFQISGKTYEIRDLKKKTGGEGSEITPRAIFIGKDLRADELRRQLNGNTVY